MALSRPVSGWEPKLELCIEQTLASARGLVSRPEGHLPIANAVAPLARYLDLAVEWNQQVDLTAARNVNEAVDLFVADAVILAAQGEFQDWVDIGTGAGAPGLPLHLLAPHCRLTLVEPRSKRIAFLRLVVGDLGLDAVQVKRCRAEQVAPGQFECGVSRATWAPQQWLVNGSRICRNAVWVLIAQGEVPTLPGWQADIDVEYVWPLTGVQRRALRFAPIGKNIDGL